MKRVLIAAMGATCSWIDGLPEWTWRIPLLHRLGCPRGLALWASSLEERWFPVEEGRRG